MDELEHIELKKGTINPQTFMEEGIAGSSSL